ncbi:hypothetical protein KC19_7G104900 [Ceratodon purpureus]|uniref:Uncharacterized protein n=1 Tax=Ceratodon purpureus TaxID=3225 RepID=A0A8T0H896_CERPU|nr:hypothetical protein KC19_7G104900 [Ceratodon purpureus]
MNHDTPSPAFHVLALGLGHAEVQKSECSNPEALSVQPTPNGPSRSLPQVRPLHRAHLPAFVPELSLLSDSADQTPNSNYLTQTSCLRSQPYVPSCRNDEKINQE